MQYKTAKKKKKEKIQKEKRKARYFSFLFGVNEKFRRQKKKEKEKRERRQGEREREDDRDEEAPFFALTFQQLSARGRQSEIKRFTATSSRKLQNLRAKGEQRPPFGYSRHYFARKIIAQTCDKLSDYGRKFEPPVLLTIENLLSVLKFKQPQRMIKDEYYTKQSLSLYIYCIINQLVN